MSRLLFIYDYLIFLSKSNPLIAGALSLYGIGILTYLLKDIPSNIYSFVKKQSTTTLTLKSTDIIFYTFLKWVNDHKITMFTRDYNLNNSKHGWNTETVMTVGYGLTYFKFNGRLFAINRTENSNSKDRIETITVTSFGRNNSVFIKLFEEIKKEKPQGLSDYINIYTWGTTNWECLTKIFKRNLDTVIIPQDNKLRLLNHITKFFNNKDWHLKHGMPWRTGILLEGPPGTGKTSLIKAVASHFNKDLYILDLNKVDPDKSEMILARVPENSIVVIEEIDSVGTRNHNKTSDDSNNMLKDLKNAKISSLLNAIDGIAGGEGRIIIATTNYYERIDPALIRDGRFNLKLHIGYLTQETFKSYLSRFYDDVSLRDNWVIKPNIAPCTLQKLIFENQNDIIKVLTEVATPGINSVYKYN